MFREVKRFTLDHTESKWQSRGLMGLALKPCLETCLSLQEVEQDFQLTASSSRAGLRKGHEAPAPWTLALHSLLLKGTKQGLLGGSVVVCLQLRV